MSRRKKLESEVSLDPDPLWYKDAVLYELHPRAFFDSNGDGVGDFRGLVRKLDYLQDLGITAIWLLPFYPSPLKDDGYDIANYTDVHPLYGTLADFKLLLREAHRRGLRVITELVLNHSSDQHPWFQRARRAPPGSPERNFYVWSDTPLKYRDARIIFKDFEPSNWTWDPVAQAYYWHRFYFHQPDLNYDNPAVHQAMFEVLDFWFGLGVDGLRLDAVPYLYERETTNCENLPETHVFLKALRRHVDEKFPNRMLLAEANQWPEDAVAYFGAGDECNMAFHFPLMPRLFMGIRMEDRFPILDILQQTPAIPDASQWALFLRNHDELTLEMVTDEDRDYMYRVYAQDPQARINLGIRRRLAPLLENHRARIELMNGLLLSLPGTPVLYYGDEIGMGDNIYLGDRNGVRTPMQWSGDRNAGFSAANPQRLYLPAIIDPEYHYEALNVETQQKNPHSLLWWTKRLIGLRKRSKAFGRGTLEFLTPENHKVLAFLRHYQDEHILVVANLSRFAQGVELDLGAYQGLVPVEMLGRSWFPPIGERPYFLTLGSHAFYWFTLEPRRAPAPRPSVNGNLPTVEVVTTWEEIFRGKNKQALEEVLPAYLATCRWFAGKERQTEAAMILETIPIAYAESTAHLCLVQVEYTEGDPETYVLPLAFAPAREAEEIKTRWPHTVVSRLRVKEHARHAGGDAPGVLYDPLGENRLAGALLAALAQHRRFKRPGGELLAVAAGRIRGRGNNGSSFADAAVTTIEKSNTSVVYGDQAVLKVFRRVEEGVNPELEIGRFLAEKTSFRHTPALLGAFEYRRSWGQSITLAVLEEYVANEGDAWRYTVDALGHYFERALMQPPLEVSLESRSLSDLFREEPPAVAQEVIGPYLAAAGLLGQRTGEFHMALASVPDDPAFAPEPFSEGYQRSLYESARTRTRRMFEQLRRRQDQLPPEARDLAKKVLEREADLIQHLRSILTAKSAALRIRCHGDFHLGQLLYTGKDFLIIDLEGESTRPLSDRRRKRSPLYDVAGMLRSFHHASWSALRNRAGRPEDLPALAPWARLWYLWVSATFLKGFDEATASGGFLPRAAEELGTLLRFYVQKHILKELAYALNPPLPRVEVPLQGLWYLLEHPRVNA